MENVPHEHTKIEVGSSRSFGLVFAGVFTIIALFPLLKDGDIRYWSLGVAAAFAGIAFVAPAILQPLNVLWFRLGMLLAMVINPIVMALIYVLTILPIGLIMRMGGKDLLRLKLENNQPSYWIERTPPGPKPDSLKDQF